MRPGQDFASWRGWEDIIGYRVPLDDSQKVGAAAWQLYEGEELPRKELSRESTLQLKKLVQQLTDSLKEKENLNQPKRGKRK